MHFEGTCATRTKKPTPLTHEPGATEMTDSADIRFLLAIQRNGSLAAAARKLIFTEDGALLCLRGSELIRQFDTLLDDLRIRHGGLVGTLKVNAPLGFGRRHLAPVIVRQPVRTLGRRGASFEIRRSHGSAAFRFESRSRGGGSAVNAAANHACRRLHAGRAAG